MKFFTIALLAFAFSASADQSQEGPKETKSDDMTELLVECGQHDEQILGLAKTD